MYGANKMYSESDILLTFKAIHQVPFPLQLGFGFPQYLNSMIDYHEFVAKTWENINATLEKGKAEHPERVSEENLQNIDVDFKMYIPLEEETLGPIYEEQDPDLYLQLLLSFKKSFASLEEARVGIEDLKNNQSMRLAFQPRGC